MTLQYGSIGGAVTNLQLNLFKLGIRPLAIDGRFGPETRSAVNAFKSTHALDANGIVDDETQKAIVKALLAQIPEVSDGKTPWINWLRSHLGEPERTGTKPTAFNEEIFSHTTYGPLYGVMQPGCAATLCAALEETGYLSTDSALANSFKTYGTECELKPGCVVVFKWASGHYHVTCCDHIASSTLVACIGGNQSHELRVSTFEKKYIVATRWPVKQMT